MFTRTRRRLWSVACALLTANAGCQTALAPLAPSTRSAEPPVAAARDASPEYATSDGLVVLPALQRVSSTETAAPADGPAAMLDPQVTPAKGPGQEGKPQPPPVNFPRPGPVKQLPPVTDAKETKDAEAAPPAVEAPATGPVTAQPPLSCWFANRCKSCQASMFDKKVPVAAAPKELHLATHPPHSIQAPDILLIESPRALPDQPIAGEHLVRSDGTVSLGLYGTVRVAGMSTDAARETIERHLSSFINEPKVHVDVYSYNSRFFYIVADNAGFGQQVYKLNCTGGETVLDAISQIGGIPSVGSKKRIWVARPSCEDEKNGLILPVDWTGITQCGQVATNYQIFPNDRIYIQSDRMQAFDGVVAKLLSPIDRILGTSLLMGLQIYRWENLGRQGFFTGAPVVVSP